MLKFTLSSLLFFLFIFANAEKGIVVAQKYTDANSTANITVTWYVTEANCKMKMEFSDGKVNSVNWFIADVANHQLLTYTEGAVPSTATKTFFAIPVQNIKGTTTSSAIKLEKTGVVKTISGFNCERIIASTNQHNTEMWVTKDFSAGFYQFAAFFQSSFELAGLNAEKILGFPLQSSTQDKSGKQLTGYSLISATPTELTAADFIVPAEYTSATKGKN